MLATTNTCRLPGPCDGGFRATRNLKGLGLALEKDSGCSALRVPCRGVAIISCWTAWLPRLLLPMQPPRFGRRNAVFAVIEMHATINTQLGNRTKAKQEQDERLKIPLVRLPEPSNCCKWALVPTERKPGVDILANYGEKMPGWNHGSIQPAL